MVAKATKIIGIGIGLIILTLALWYAIEVFLLAFAAILLAILLHALGAGTAYITRLPYPLALVLGLIVILGLFALTFWLYSPLIALQAQQLINQLPQAIANLYQELIPYFGNFISFETIQKEIGLSDGKWFTSALTIFSSTIGAIVGFFLFLLLGFYLAFSPKRYVNWFQVLLSPSKVWEIIEKIGQSLRWWLLGKVASMILIGLLTFIGLWILNVSLAFILGLLAGLLAFIPYVGAIIAAIPAILIAFAQSPWLALYVTLLYIGIHILDGYLITPFIEQRTVSIPPATSVLVQASLLILIGFLGIALATPLMVVAIALIHSTRSRSAAI